MAIANSSDGPRVEAREAARSLPSLSSLKEMTSTLNPSSVAMHRKTPSFRGVSMSGPSTQKSPEKRQG